MDKNYKKMWEDIGCDAGESHLEIKFRPTYRIGLTYHLRETFIYKLLSPQKEDVVLDVGCASGRQLSMISNKIKEGYGVDIAQSFIDKASSFKEKNNIQNLFFQKSIIEELPFRDNFFDKIICAEILEHVFNKDIALTEVLRVLKRGGILLITVPNLNADGTLWGRFLRFLRIRKFKSLESFSQKELFRHGDSHVREFNNKSLEGWLRGFGLDVLDIKSVSFIDGPFIDFLLKVPLHIKFLRNIIIKLEMFLTDLNLFWGRHLLIKVKK